MDFFTVPTVCFQILYIFVILNHSRRQVVHFAVTAHPTMAWVIQQLREAMPFGQQRSYLFRASRRGRGGSLTKTEPAFALTAPCAPCALAEAGQPIPAAPVLRQNSSRL